MLQIISLRPPYTFHLENEGFKSLKSIVNYLPHKHKYSCSCSMQRCWTKDYDPLCSLAHLLFIFTPLNPHNVRSSSCVYLNVCVFLIATNRLVEQVHGHRNPSSWSSSRLRWCAEWNLIQCRVWCLTLSCTMIKCSSERLGTSLTVA